MNEPSIEVILTKVRRARCGGTKRSVYEVLSSSIAKALKEAFSMLAGLLCCYPSAACPPKALDCVCTLAGLWALSLWPETLVALQRYCKLTACPMSTLCLALLPCASDVAAHASQCLLLLSALPCVRVRAT
eukprot:827013-Pelagomonas_calceolata.AAC.1